MQQISGCFHHQYNYLISLLNTTVFFATEMLNDSVPQDNCNTFKRMLFSMVHYNKRYIKKTLLLLFILFNLYHIVIRPTSPFLFFHIFNFVVCLPCSYGLSSYSIASSCLISLESGPSELHVAFKTI